MKTVLEMNMDYMTIRNNYQRNFMAVIKKYIFQRQKLPGTQCGTQTNPSSREEVEPEYMKPRQGCQYISGKTGIGVPDRNICGSHLCRGKITPTSRS